jgi:UPF0176 protein
LKGRILIAEEGINGTIAGLPENVDQYIADTTTNPLFSDMEWKVSWSDDEVFPKLKVVVRDEIVTLGVKKNGNDVSLDNKAQYIEPEELLHLYEKNEDFLILDARNEYEATVGKFKNALIPPIDNFREFPAFAKSLENYKDKEIVTYCTGGVRCEKASAYLREHGFEKVRQLHGGIHEYGEKTSGKHFEGCSFLTIAYMSVNSVNPTIISECIYCKTKIARYVDAKQVVMSCSSVAARRKSTFCAEQMLQSFTSI